MGRKKGTEKTGGRKAGTPNKVTGTVKEWIQKVIDGKRQQFENDLDDLEPGERVRVISNLLQYVTPKMQSASPEELLDYCTWLQTTCFKYPNYWTLHRMRL